MQKYYQRLIFLALCIAISNAEVTISSFKDTSPDIDDESSTVYATHAELWVVVVGCEASGCECKVKIEGSGNAPQVVKFRKNTPNVGSVTFPNLKAETNYSFLLTCGEGKSPPSKVLNIKTDYGYPQAPIIISASVASDHVSITWSPPSISKDSYTYYEIFIDQISVSTVLKNETSYKATTKLEAGHHTLNMITCYKATNEINPLCSDKNDAKFSFDKVDPTTTTVPPPTTTTANATTATTAKSSGVPLYSFSLPIILSVLYLISKL